MVVVRVSGVGSLPASPSLRRPVGDPRPPVILYGHLGGGERNRCGDGRRARCRRARRRLQRERVRPEQNNSDGPRRIFFQPDGTAITAGNFSSTGGQLLQKPDLAAATCVTTATPGFSTFCGTSSAAPHAAAIAALMLEAAGGPNQVTLAELRTGMTTGTAVLDIEATGVDRDSGAGIVMAPGAVDAVDVAVADRNGAPTVENAESDRTFAPGDDAVDIDLEDVFDDPDDDTLTYEAISSDPDRLTITRSNAQVTITPGLARPCRGEVARDRPRRPECHRLRSRSRSRRETGTTIPITTVSSTSPIWRSWTPCGTT